jgi:hypothetical protein
VALDAGLTSPLARGITSRPVGRHTEGNEFIGWFAKESGLARYPPEIGWHA